MKRCRSRVTGARWMALAFLFFACSVQAAPFAKWITFGQPDGRVVRIWGEGDEFYAVFEDENGYTVVFDQATKEYHYARLSSDGSTLEPAAAVVGRDSPAKLGVKPHLRISEEARKRQVEERFTRWDAGMEITRRWNERKAVLRATEAEGALAPPSYTTTGTKIGLCLLIDFSDDVATITQSNINMFCNGYNYTGYGNNGSVRQYYSDMSGGLLNYSNVVTIYIRMTQPKSYYNNTSLDCGDQANLMIRDAIAIMTSRSDYASTILPAFNNLTVDSSSNVVACNVYYAGGNGGVWMYGLWPHSWSLYNVGAQYLSRNGKKVYKYQVTNIGSSLELGTFCHENGHMLCDYPDIYDYDYDSIGGAGTFCLMNSGGHGVNPVHICAYLKRASGWVNTVDLAASNVQMGAVSGTTGTNFNRIYRYKKPTANTEYFLIENRQSTGRDDSLPASGLAIWHVDELGDRDDQSLATNALHNNYEVTLEQADNLWHFQSDANSGDSRDLYYQGNSAAAYTGRFDDDSGPNARWWDGSRSGLRIQNISASGSTMTFDLLGTFSTNVQVAKTAHTNTVALGVPLNYTVRVVNAGTVIASGVVVTDTLPASVTVQTVTPSQGTWSQTGQKLTWTVGSLATSAVMTVVVTPGSTGVITNAATAYAAGDTNLADNSAAVTTAVVAAYADLALTKVVNRPFAGVGSNLVFTVAASNRGPHMVTTVTIQDALPAGLTLLGSGTSSGTYSSASGLWTLTNLSLGRRATLVITCLVAAGSAEWVITNRAAVSSQLPADNVSTNNAALARVFVNPTGFVWAAYGSPAIAADPPSDQNSAGESLDVNTAGGSLNNRSAGGFGSLGQIWVNYDASNLYLSAAGAQTAGSNNALLVFVYVNTLTNSLSTNVFRTASGAPYGLSTLDNLFLRAGADVALVLGDEYGDGTYSNFNLGSGYDFGQGVFYLRTNGFPQVAGARLSQFDGQSTNAVAGPDDDGNRLTDRWEAALPWSALNATGLTSLTSLEICGVLASDGVSGSNRYLSGSFVGLLATNSVGLGLDDFNNYAFTTCHLAPSAIQLPTARVSVAVSAVSTSVAVGLPMQFRYTVSNMGPRAVNGLRITNLLSASATFLGAELPQGTAMLVGTQVVFDIGTLGAGASLVATSSYLAGQAGRFTNRVAGTGLEKNPNATSSTNVVVTVVVQPVLQVTPASWSFGPVGIGVEAYGGFTVSNAGSGVLTGTVRNASGVFTLQSPTNYTLGAGGVTQLTVRFQPPAGGVFSSGLVFSSNGGAATNGLSGEGVVTEAPDVAVTLSAAPQPLELGGALVLTIGVTNRSGVPAAQVTVTNRYAADALLFQGALPAASPDQGLVVWHLGSFSGGAFTSLSLSALFTNAAWMAFASNEVLVAAEGGETNVSNNSAYLLVELDHDGDGIPTRLESPSGDGNDDGAPGFLDADETFDLQSLNPGMVTWQAMSGGVFVLQSATSMPATIWQTLGAPVTAEQTSATASNSSGDANARYFRVLLQEIPPAQP